MCLLIHDHMQTSDTVLAADYFPTRSECAVAAHGVSASPTLVRFISFCSIQNRSVSPIYSKRFCPQLLLLTVEVDGRGGQASHGLVCFEAQG